MAALGLDPFLFFNTRDSFERSLIDQLRHRAMDARRKLDENLATMIANKISQIMPK